MQARIPQIILLIDDTSVILIITLLGINLHQTDPSMFSRLPFTFLPMLLSWVFFALTLQLYDTLTASAWSQLWRVPLSAALTGAVGSTIRSFWLGTPLVPIFILVMGAALATGLLISRSIFILILGKRLSTPNNG
jgi:hypothetical protein